MKASYALWIAVCLSVACPAAAAYESRGACSCAAWQEYRQDEKAGNTRNAEVYQTWVIGYLSGMVAGTGIDFLAGTENEPLFQMIDSFCDAHLQLNLAAAGTYVARTLMRQKGIVNTGTLP